MAPGNRRRSAVSVIDTQITSSDSGSVAPARKIDKKIRGKSRGVRLDRLITSANGQLHVDFSSGKPKGPNAEMFSTEIGIVVRSHAPLNVEKWDDIPEEQTQPLIDRVLSKFDVDISKPYVKDWMLKRMRLRFNGFRNKLNEEFKSFSDKKTALENQPKYLDSQEYWVFLCDRFDSAKFQDRSNKNKKNRGGLPVHCGGSKSFDQHMMEMEVEEGKAPGKIALFKKLHWSEGKGWIKPEAETLYEAMIGYLGNEDFENGSEPISEAEICIKVLENKSGYLKGLGIVMPQKTSSSSSNVVSPENIELKEKVEHQDQLIKELQAQNAKIMAIMSKFESSNIGSFNMDQDSQLS
ncbi:hypothetical protein LWI29_033395 [Acer saccharum]|uniref:Transposase n=1 Tax=Acer saccharum TaxID=4024 RepID=A0AA39TJG3_ACESA|nr:hypothetical protein LWI29_033395 [Acer saccharum]